MDLAAGRNDVNKALAWRSFTPTLHGAWNAAIVVTGGKPQSFGRVRLVGDMAEIFALVRLKPAVMVGGDVLLLRLPDHLTPIPPADAMAVPVDPAFYEHPRLEVGTMRLMAPAGEKPAPGRVELIRGHTFPSRDQREHQRVDEWALVPLCMFRPPEARDKAPSRWAVREDMLNRDSFAADSVFNADIETAKLDVYIELNVRFRAKIGDKYWGYPVAADDANVTAPSGTENPH